MSNDDLLLEAARAYFDGKLPLREYQDFKNQHRMFSPTRTSPPKSGL